MVGRRRLTRPVSCAADPAQESNRPARFAAPGPGCAIEQDGMRPETDYNLMTFGRFFPTFAVAFRVSTTSFALSRTRL